MLAYVLSLNHIVTTKALWFSLPLLTQAEEVE